MAEMQRFEEVQMMGKLEELRLFGFTMILWAQLYSWYRAKRIDKRTWRDIRERWTEYCISKGVPEDQVPKIEVWGAYGSQTGGITLLRPHDEDLDGNKKKLSDLGDPKDADTKGG